MLVSCDLISFMLCVSGTLLMHSQGRWSLSLCGKCMYKCWPKYCELYLSCLRKAFTSSCFSGEITMPPIFSCLTVNVFPGNACWRCCFVMFRSVCGLRFEVFYYNWSDSPTFRLVFCIVLWSAVDGVCLCGSLWVYGVWCLV